MFARALPVVLALLAPSPALAQDATPACHRADELLTARLLDLAESVYLEANEAGEGQCATDGLDEIQAMRERVKRDILVANRVAPTNAAQARARYRHALVLDPYSAVARSRLEALLAPTEAKQAKEDAPEGLPAKAKQRGETWLTSLSDLGVFTIAVLAWLAAGAALVLACAWLVRPWAGPAVQRRWDTTAASDRSRWLRLTHWLYRRELRVTDFTGPSEIDGGALAAVTSAAMSDGGTWRRGTVDRLTTASADPGMLDAFTKALAEIPRGKLLGALLPALGGLLPRGLVELRARVTSNEPADATLALTLVRRRGTVIDATALRAADYNPDKHVFKRLSVAAASWTRHALIGDPLREQQVLGARDWRSSARFAAATSLRGDETRSTQRELFARALDFDPANQAARYNLAFLDIADEEYERAARRLGDVRHGLDRFDTRSPLGRHASWFAATYNLAAVELYRPTAGSKARAWGFARELVLEVVRARAAVSNPRLDERERLLLFLDGIEGTALVLLASARLEATRTPGDMNEDDPVPGHWRNDLTRRLAPMTAPPFDDMPPGVPVLEAREIVERYLRHGLGDLQPRTHYNLACFYARVAKRSNEGIRRDALARALEELPQGLEMGLSRKWVESDPGLRPLRNARQVEFDRCIGKLPEAPTRELAGLRAVPASEAASLESTAGVRSFSDLLRRAAKRRDRTVLADRTGRSRILLRRWAELAELATTDGFTLDEVNLLDEARHGSLVEIRNARPEALHELLVDIVELDAKAMEAPSLKRVKELIEAARAATGTVEE